MTRLALSSAWKSSLARRGGAVFDPLLEALHRHPLRGLVLDEGVSAQALDDVRAVLDRREVALLALRGEVGRAAPRDTGVFQGETPPPPEPPAWPALPPPPMGRARSRRAWFDTLDTGVPARPALPPPARPRGPAPIAYALRPRLCAPEAGERESAVAEWTRVVELAHAREVPLVCLGLGATDPAAAEPFTALARSLDEAETEALGRAERRARPVRPRCLDGARFALEALARRAEPLGVALALENALLPLQLPGPEELAALLRDFAGGPLAYAHDAGAARVCRGLGGAPGREYLDAGRAALRLLFVSDARGSERGLVPGRGELDLEGLARAVPEVPAVLSPRTDWTEGDLDAALTRLRAAGF